MAWDVRRHIFSATGLQLDLSYKLGASHTLRTGAGYARQLTHSDNAVAVFPADGTAPKCRRSIYTGSDNVKAERTNYYDVGISHQVNSRLTGDRRCLL